MRSEFSAKTKVEAFTRCGGRCEKCTARLFPGNTEYDHSTACGIGGGNSVGNCVALCRACHRLKTSADDVPRIAKAKRNHRHNAGVKRPRTITRWRRFNGDIVFAERQR